MDASDPVAPGVILLGVEDACAGAHALSQTRIDDALVAFGVLVDEGAPEHPGDDFHVPVWMGLESRSGGDNVVVVDEQQPVMGVTGVPVVAEGEGVLGVEPADAGREALFGSANVDGRAEEVFHAQGNIVDMSSIPGIETWASVTG